MNLNSLLLTKIEERIIETLRDLGDYGSLKVIVTDGEIRYIEITKTDKLDVLPKRTTMV